MSKKTTLVLTILVAILFTESKGNPALVTENNEANPTVSMGSRITPRIGEWVKFHGKWSFPSLTAVTNLFNDKSDENKFSVINKRLDNLENMQQEIIDIIQKMAQDIVELSRPVDNKNDDSPSPNEGQEPLKDEKPEEAKPNLASDSYIEGENSAEATVHQEIPEKIESSVDQKIPQNIETPVDQEIPEKNETSVNQEIAENIDTSVDHGIPEKFENQVNQEIPEKFEGQVDESKPEVAKPKEEYKSANMARSQGFRANGRIPWNNDNN